MSTIPMPAYETLPTRPSRRFRLWDLLLTLGLFLVALCGAGIGVVIAFSLVFLTDGCGASVICDYDRLGTGVSVALFGPWVPIIVFLVVGIVLLALRRIAFWTGISAVVGAGGVWILGVVIVFTAFGR